MNIYVGNLSFNTTSQELENLFSAHGTVQSAQVILDRDTQRSRGFAFVEMSDDEARNAINELNGRELGGRSLKVNQARERR